MALVDCVSYKEITSLYG